MFWALLFCPFDYVKPGSYIFSTEQYAREDKMHTTIEIIGMTEVIELYGFSRKEATRLLNTKGCPVLPRQSGQPYRIVKEEFENWLRTRKC